MSGLINIVGENATDDTSNVVITIGGNSKESIVVSQGQQKQDPEIIQINTGSAITANSIKRGQGSADDYEKLEHRDHIYQIPDTYIGSDEKIPRQDRVLDLSDPQNPQFKTIDLSLPEGVERLYLEILSNAGDNVQKSRESGVDVGKIEISMDYGTVSIKNGGVPIPIQINTKSGEWAPDMIMGNLLTGSNYNDQRTGAGRNGYGAKLCNIFSKNFSIIVGDPYNKKKYTQTWTDNMLNRGEPIIEEGYDGESFVHIIYQMDFQRFGYLQYPDETFSVFARHAADIAFTCKVPVIFNGIHLEVQNVHEYCKWMYPDNSNVFVHYEWPTGTVTKNRRIGNNTVPIAADKNVVPIIEMAVIDTPDEGSLLAYVNGITTRDGGVHVDKAYRSVGDSVLGVINKTKIAKQSKNTNTNSRALKLDISHIKRHTTIVISYRTLNPKFTSQQKTKLSAPTPIIKIDDAALKPLMKWDLINRLYAELEAKQYRALGKTDGQKKKHVNVKKYERANFSGTAKGINCTLCITEGDSASGYAKKMLSFIQQGRDYYGIFPMKGKPLNVMGAMPLKIAENKEICDLKQILGLKENVDYTIDSNYRQLRYGHLLIMADADVDGKHIIGLVLNIFYCRYPSLFARGFVRILRTPIILLEKGNQRHSFLTMGEYQEFADKTSNIKSWTTKYLKGLGSSSTEDVKRESSDLHIVNLISDMNTPAYFTLAFHPKHADDRKVWIAAYQPYPNIEKIIDLPISIFINHEMIEHSIANIGRSLPGFDGLKESQRKIIWGSMLKWGAKVGTTQSMLMKTGRLVSAVADSTNYHYGEDSLISAIAHMVWDFPGTNNLPIFVAGGNFGTRHQAGKDAAAPRYTSTKPEWWWPYIFRKDDHDIRSHRPYLTLVEDEGESWEPKVMLPILPLGMINGCRGIGTGYSTFIPNYNPIDICVWIRSKIMGYPTPKLEPWFRDFTGDIRLIDRLGEKKCKTNDDNGIVIVGSADGTSNISIINDTENEEDSLSEDSFDDPLSKNELDDDPLGKDEFEIESVSNIDGTTTKKMSLITEGVFRLMQDGVHITELPIERCGHDYEMWLKQLLVEKVITDYDNQSKFDKPYFIVKGMKNPSLKKLRLVKSFGMTNMVVIDTNNKPIRFSSDIELIETWYTWRLPYYSARKEFILGNIAVIIATKNDKIRFIQAVIAGTERGPILGETIVILKQKKVDIYPQMDALQIPQELLNTTKLSNCTEDEISRLLQEIETLEIERKTLFGTSPEQLWMNDLDEFENVYRKHYNIPLNTGVNIV